MDNSNSYIKDGYESLLSDEDFGTVPHVPIKKNYDWTSFGLGLAGGVSTALWYAGVTTAALGGLPFLAGGVVLSGVSMYLVMPEQMTTTDKFVLAGGVAASGLFCLGVVNHGLGYMLMGGITGGVSYYKDSHDVLKQASPSLVGINLGFGGAYEAMLFASGAVNEARRESIDNPFAQGYNPDTLPKGIQHKAGLQVKFHEGASVPSYYKQEAGGTFAIKTGRYSTKLQHPHFADSAKDPVVFHLDHHGKGGLIGMIHDFGCWNPFEGNLDN